MNLGDHFADRLLTKRTFFQRRSRSGAPQLETPPAQLAVAFHQFVFVNRHGFQREAWRICNPAELPPGTTKTDFSFEKKDKPGNAGIPKPGAGRTFPVNRPGGRVFTN